MLTGYCNKPEETAAALRDGWLYTGDGAYLDDRGYVVIADRGEPVHAVVILVPGSDLTIEELRAHCRTEIAGYKWPRSFDVVAEFPVSGAGKVLKRELHARYV